MTEMPEPTRHGEAIWLEPFPDVLLEGIPDQAPGPEARYEAREAIELGFVVGLQHLPPPQRAVLVLRDVLGYRAEEVAAMLDTTAHAVNNLLRRAHAAFESRLPAAGRERAPLPGSKGEREVVGRFADAFQAGDIPAAERRDPGPEHGGPGHQGPASGPARRLHDGHHRGLRGGRADRRRSAVPAGQGRLGHPDRRGLAAGDHLGQPPVVFMFARPLLEGHIGPSTPSRPSTASNPIRGPSIVLQIATNIYYFRAGLYDPGSALYAPPAQ